MFWSQTGKLHECRRRSCVKCSSLVFCFQLFVSCQLKLRQIRAEENQPEQSAISCPTITTVCCGAPEKQPVFLLCRRAFWWKRSAFCSSAGPIRQTCSSPVPLSLHKSILYVSINALLINGYLARMSFQMSHTVLTNAYPLWCDL